MSTRPHILVIFGSTRQGRRGEIVANWLMDRLALRTDATYELVDLRDVPLPFFDSSNAMITELLWWATALIPAREHDRQQQN